MYFGLQCQQVSYGVLMVEIIGQLLLGKQASDVGEL
jgi:hypothetical protein